MVSRVLGDSDSNDMQLRLLKEKFSKLFRRVIGNPNPWNDRRSRRRSKCWRQDNYGHGDVSRLDCIVTSSAIMRADLADAVHHTYYRWVSKTDLVDRLLMQMLLADMALNVAGAAELAFRLAHSFDEATSDRG